jgi:hypothetical protein
MANAPDPQGVSGVESSAVADASDDAPEVEEKKYSEAEHKAEIDRILKTRLAKLSKAAQEAEALRQRTAELEAQLAEKGNASKSELEILKDRLAKSEKDAAARVAAAELAAANERTQRHGAIIKHAIQAEINKRGWKEPDLIEAYLLRNLVVDDNGDVVRRDSENLQTDLKSVLDEFGKAHPGVVPSAPAGSGSRPGTPARAGKKLPGEMTGAELENATQAYLEGMRGHRGVPD